MKRRNPSTKKPKVTWSSVWSSVKKAGVFIALSSLILHGVFYFYVVQPHNQRIEELEVIKTELEKNQTRLTEKIAELTENQSLLEQQIFEIQNYQPTINMQSIQTIEIGPTPPITVLEGGRVSFEYEGMLYLNLTVLVSTAHSGKLTIIGDSLSLLDYNMSEIQVGFSYSGITANDYPAPPFRAGDAEIISINMPFEIYYKFSESHILEYETKYIATLRFRIQFYDFQTEANRYDQWKQTPFMWNNQTSLP